MIIDLWNINLELQGLSQGNIILYLFTKCFGNEKSDNLCTPPLYDHMADIFAMFSFVHLIGGVYGI